VFVERWSGRWRYGHFSSTDDSISVIRSATILVVNSIGPVLLLKLEQRCGATQILVSSNSIAAGNVAMGTTRLVLSQFNRLIYSRLKQFYGNLSSHLLGLLEIWYPDLVQLQPPLLSYVGRL